MTDVSIPIADYDAMAIDWHLPETLMGGTKAMREAGLTYLPREGQTQTVNGESVWVGESTEAWERRLQRTVLFNAFKRAVYALRGRVFAKPVQFGDDTPEDWQAIADDIDLAGRDLTAFAYDLMEAGIVYGLSHVFVDHPDSFEGATAADELSMNMRPFLVHIKPRDLIGWKIAYLGGVRTLEHIRFRQWDTRQVGDYDIEHIEQIRVIYRDRWELWENAGSWAMVSEGVNRLGVVPLATYYTGRTADMIAAPPLLDLAYKNLEHWQSSSDQRHILHVARMPILFGSGFDGQTANLELGPNRMITSTDPQAKLQYVEHTGAAISAGADDLRTIEEQMSLLAMEPIMPKTGGLTATARALDEAQANSALQAWALNLQDTLDEAMDFAARWMSQDDAPDVAVNTEYGLTLEKGEDAKLLRDLRMTRDLSRDTLWQELKRRGILADQFDPEDEADRLTTDSGIGL